MSRPSRRPRHAPWLPRILVAITAALVLGIVVAEWMRKPPPDRAAPIEARLELAAGEVLVGYDEAESPAASQTPLRAGAMVETRQAARALLRLPDGSAAFLRGGTRVVLEEQGLRLERGEYFLDAPLLEREPLVHRIGAVEVSAVDAGLSIKLGDGVAEVYVARGMAVVTSPGGRVEAHAGEIVSAAEAAAPKVAPLAFWEDWTGGMSDHGGSMATIAAGNGEIYGVDREGPDGRPADRLQIKSQSVRVAIRSGLAETEVDQTFFNPSPRDVEGWYWFSVPAGASVTGFAVESDGSLIEGELIERGEAAARYSEAKETGHAPAILEWVDATSYRARIYPIPSSGTRRVVLRYLELLPTVNGKIGYVYPMAGRAPMRIGELSLRVDLGDEGQEMQVATLAEAKVDQGGRVVTMRRSGYTPRVDFQLEATLPEKRNSVKLARFASGSESADYVMARYTPEIPANLASRPADVVVVVDTSAAGDEASRMLKVGVTEAILRSLSSADRFSLIAVDAQARALYPAKGLAPAKEEEITKALAALASREAGGATDLSAFFPVALERVHGSSEPAVVYVGDGVATSGALTGEQLIERLRRALATSHARLFSIAVGPEADAALLGELARAGGGASLRVEDPRQATSRALELVSALKMPTITDFELDLGAGLDEPFANVSGKVSRGHEVVLLARTHHALPDRARVRGRLGGEPFDHEVEIEADGGILGAFVPRLWAAEYVRRLLGASAGAEAERGRIAELGLDYGLMTPFTSILALESEKAFKRMGIHRNRSPLRGVRLGALDARGEREVKARLFPFEAPAFGCVFSRSSSDEQAAEPLPSKYVSEAGRIEEGNLDPADSKDSDRGEAARPGEDDRGGRAKSDVPKRDVPMSDEPMSDEAPLPQGMVGQGAGTGRGRPQTAAPVVAVQAALGTCSAEARRPLRQRLAVWRKRLATARDGLGLIERYAAALRACELSDWQAERVFLDVMQQHIASEADARLVLAALADRAEVQRHLGKLLLRRVVDERIVLSVQEVLFGAVVDWERTDRDLTLVDDVAERIALLRVAMGQAPDDPNGIIRLVGLMVEAGRHADALNLARRLREKGLLTLEVVRKLGDVLARQDLVDEAVRTYSEIVEFDPHNAASRWLLGDIYLARGWYDPAYRQYETAAELSPGDPLGFLRLAHAAEGSGRIDEALRLDRRVASAEGRPGRDDPRRWARLSSAARLARLLEAPPAGVDAAALQRKLKELGLFHAEGTLVLLSWPDLTSDLVLVSRDGDAVVAAGEPFDAAPVGLSALLLSKVDASRLAMSAHLRSLPRAEPLVVSRHDIRWDGERFAVRVTRGALAAGATRTDL